MLMARALDNAACILQTPSQSKALVVWAHVPNLPYFWASRPLMHLQPWTVMHQRDEDRILLSRRTFTWEALAVMLYFGGVSVPPAHHALLFQLTTFPMCLPIRG